MKPIITVLLFVLLSAVIHPIKATEPVYRLDVGYMFVNNNLNRNEYYINNYRNFNEELLVKPTFGVNMKFSKSTSNRFIRLFVGTLFIQSPATYTTIMLPDKSKALYYKLNGGGVYAGASPTIGNKYFGLTSDLGIGVFSVKEYRTVYHLDEPANLDTFDRRASSGLGAISSIGFYLKFHSIGIAPQLQTIYTGGGAETSFTFWGLNFPITISF